MMFPERPAFIRADCSEFRQIHHPKVWTLEEAGSGVQETHLCNLSSFCALPRFEMEKSYFFFFNVMKMTMS